VLKYGENLTLQGLRTAGKERTIIFALCILSFWFAPDSGISAGTSKGPMQGPHADNLQSSSTREPPTSCVQIAFLESIKFYQKRISPIYGNRCGFRPSCSRYGYEAVTTQGSIMGIMMTGDRLTRCNIWKSPGPDYFLLPNGRLYDPLSKNLLEE
jgi:putative membrane protein insertion efficiency factor